MDTPRYTLTPVIVNGAEVRAMKPRGNRKWDFPLEDLLVGQAARYHIKDPDRLESAIKAARSLIGYYQQKENDDRKFSCYRIEGGFAIERKK